MIKEYLKVKRQQVDQALDRYLPLQTEEPMLLHEAMRYSVFAGGKRLRPILLCATVEALGGVPESCWPAAAALECIHTCTLIHDDMPVMDNDDYRRGKLTNHKVFGEDMALLAGDGLLAHAFLVLAQDQVTYSSAFTVTQLTRELAQATSSYGLVGGQVGDLLAEKGRLPHNKKLLHWIHERKTGALIIASVRMGAILAGCEASQLVQMTAFASKLGLAFQIKDDILDIEGQAELLGKTIGKDVAQQKLTFPSIYGLDQSKEMCRALLNDSLKDIAFLEERGAYLAQLARFVVNRDH